METQVKTVTNNQPRPVLYGFELTKKEQSEFDYLNFNDDESGAFATFFRYKGNVYHIGDSMVVEPMNSLCKGWQGYFGESYFSAVVFKYADNNCESVIVGQVFS